MLRRGNARLKATLPRGAWTRWRTKPSRICERAVAPTGEAPSQSEILELLSRTSGRHTAPRRRVLSTAAPRSHASFLALQESWTLLVRSGRTALPSPCRGTRKHDHMV